MGPLVSVVVPTYGRDAGALRRALASVARQSHDAVELLVVDDSPPGSGLRERALDGVDTAAFAALRWLADGDHDGAGAARNTGLRAAEGAYVAFLDDDDTWHERKLERQLAAFTAGVGLVYCGQRYVDAEGETVGVGSVGPSGDVLADLLAGRGLAPFSTAVVRADVPERVGFIDERLPVLEDREWYLRVARAYRVGAVAEPLVDRRTGGTERLSADWEGLSERTYPVLLEKHRSLAAAHGRLTERRFLAWLNRTVAATGVATGHRRAARPYLLRAIRAYPLDLRLYVYLALSLGGSRLYGSARRLRRALAAVRHRL
jgi:glycosyltransferase involved in cell wall biosynthesis